MKVGDYIRVDNGCICKVLDYTDISDNDFYVNTDSEYNVIYKSWIVKSSPNIIDLIEEGDYVNGLRVEKNKYRELYTSYVYYGGDIGKQREVYTTWLKDYKEDEIISIVTKEQFERMEYKIND